MCAGKHLATLTENREELKILAGFRPVGAE
jgi:hypothetical protein